MSKPIIVRDGTVSIPIYLTPVGQYDSWTVAYPLGGRRVRRRFKTMELAREHATEQARRIANGQTVAASMSNPEAASFARAIELLAPVGKPIEIAASQFAEAAARLGGVPLSAAVDCYLRVHPATIQTRAIAETVDEMIASKQGDGLSAAYIKELKTRLGKFKARFIGPLANVIGTEIDTWLRSLGVSPRTRNNYRTCLNTLFSYAKARRYMPRDWSEMEAVPVAKEPAAPIEILSVEEMTALLSAAMPSLVPFLAIAGFAGLRHEEILRLDWREINFAAGHIEVKAANAKTASRRLAPLPANLKAILKPIALKSGPVVSGVVHMKLRRLAEKLGTKWKRNALRHSFISYRVAVTQNVNQVSLEAGNSPRIIFSNYRALVSGAQARQWFKICHKTVAKDSAPESNLLKAPIKVAF